MTLRIKSAFLPLPPPLHPHPAATSTRKPFPLNHFRTLRLLNKTKLNPFNRLHTLCTLWSPKNLANSFPFYRFRTLEKTTAGTQGLYLQALGKKSGALRFFSLGPDRWLARFAVLLFSRHSSLAARHFFLTLFKISPLRATLTENTQGTGVWGLPAYRRQVLTNPRMRNVRRLYLPAVAGLQTPVRKSRYIQGASRNGTRPAAKHKPGAQQSGGKPPHSKGLR